MRPSIVSCVEELVGDTPLLRLSLPGVPDGVRLLAKLELFNPTSSVKDRAALNMLAAAERDGRLAPGGTVVEYSSGNTGISLAGLCAGRGHPFVLVMPDNATEERCGLVRAFGGRIVFTPHEGGLPATIEMARQVAASIPGAWLVDQSNNHDNTEAHYARTGPEILRACGGEIGVFVSPVGTGGTLTGVARYLKEHVDVHVVAVEPERSPVLSGGEPGPHGIPGIGPGFIAATTDVGRIDEIVTVSDVDAGSATRQIAARNGVLVGVSSGAAAHAARVVAGRPRWAGATVVVVLPDSGERYLSIWDTLGAQADRPDGADS